MVKLVNTYTTRRWVLHHPLPWAWRPTKLKSLASEKQQPSVKRSLCDGLFHAVCSAQGETEDAQAGGGPPQRDGRAEIQAILLPGLFSFAPSPRGQAACLVGAVSAPPLLLLVLLFPISCLATGAPQLCDLGVGRRTQDKVHSDPGSWHLFSSSGL